MTAAKIITKRFVTCPGCGQYDYPVEHLFDGTERRFYRWECQADDCLTEISGTIYPDGRFDIEHEVNPYRQRGFALLKFRDLYLIKRERYGRISAEHADYFYHSHQCPTNILNDVVEVYDQSGRSDVHGMIRYVGGIDDTPETRSALRDELECTPSLRKVLELFKTDGEPIETNWPEVDGGMIPFVAELQREHVKKS